MARKKKSESISIIEAVESLEDAKNYSREYIIESLKAALAKAYSRTYLGNWDDADVKVEINEQDNTITFLIGKKIVASEDEIEDDFIQVYLSKSQLDELGLNVGDTYYERVPFDEIKNDANSYRFMKTTITSFQSRLIEAERKAILEKYGSMIGELITGTVERVSATKEVFVNIGKTVEVLERRDLIGDETFRPGDSIFVVIVDVEPSPKGAKIHISRSDKLFVQRIFEREITEVYNGTVKIHDIARRAGVRSKVAVYTDEPNIDPCGACIGQNGSRTQTITSYLGNGKEKEKLDVVLYNPNIELYIAEALVPGHIVGLALDKVRDQRTGKEVNHAIAIARNGETATTVGINGVNVFLASILTGYKIDVMELDEALEKKVSFKYVEDIKRELESKALVEDFASVEASEEIISHEEEKAEALEAPETEVAHEEVKEAPVHEEVKVEEHVTPIDVVKMDDLLSKLEEEKQASTKQSKPKKSFKKKEDKVEEQKSEEPKKKVEGMAIYTDAELEELKRQEELEDEEESYGVDQDDDYDEYDSDEYYDN